MCKYRRDIRKRWPYHSALPLTKSKTQWARSLSLVRGGFHSSAFCDYPPTRNHATHRGSLILQTCRGGRGLQILTVITLNIIHTVQTVIKAWKWHGRAVIAEGRRNEEERKRVNSPQWVPGEQVLLTCSPCLSLPFLLVQSCDSESFLCPIYSVNLTPFQFEMCVLCCWNISPNVLQDNHRTLQSGCPDVFTVQVKQNTVKSFWQVHCGVLMYARVRVLLILAKSTVQYSVTICTTVTTYSIIIPDFLAWIIWICSIWIDRMYLFFICIYLNQ